MKEQIEAGDAKKARAESIHGCKVCLVGIAGGSYPIDLLKYSDKSNLRGDNAIFSYSSRLQFIMAGKPRHQELNVADCITSTVRTLNICMFSAQFTFFQATVDLVLC